MKTSEKSAFRQILDCSGAITLITALALAFLSPASAAVTGELKQWHKVTLSFQGPQTSESATTNPFSDYRLDLTFTHTDSGTSYRIPGYYAADGDAAESSATNGNIWMAHFMPDQTGEWTYTASFRTGQGVSLTNDPNAGGSAGFFDGSTGTFNIAVSDKSGVDFRSPDKGKLLYTGEHALQWAGSGDFFFKVGMNHPEVFLQYNDFDNTPSSRSYGAHQQDAEAGDPTWQAGKGSEILGVVNYLSGEGMNVQYFLAMNLRGDGKQAYPYTGSPGDEEVFRFDVSKLSQWGRVFDHMIAKGVMPHLVFDEQENQSLHEVLDPSSSLFADSRKLLYREMVARFGHLNAITWNLGEESGWQNSNTLGAAVTTQQRKDFAAHLDDLLAYEDLIVVHNGPSGDDSIYTGLLGDPSYNGAAMQRNLNDPATSYDRLALRRQQSAASGRKWVVTYDEPYVSGQPGRDTWRKNALWPSITAGCAGAEIYSNQDLSLTDWRTFSTLYSDMRRAKEFLHQQKIPFWRMDPDKSLVSAGYALAEAGETYLIYLPNGGSSQTLDLTSQSGSYHIQWFNPRADDVLLDGSVNTVTGGSVVGLGAPPADTASDWAVLVTRQTKIAYIYGDVAADGTVPSGAAAPYDQMLLTDSGDTGLSIFKNLVEDEGYQIEQFYDQSTTLDAAFLDQFGVIIFGLHQKIWSSTEKAALDAWLQGGGGMLTYSDSASGGRYDIVGAQNPVGQNVVNNLVAQYGLQVTVDNTGGTRSYTSSEHSIFFDGLVLEGEGISPVAVDSTSGAQVLIPFGDAYKVSGSSMDTPNNTTGVTIPSQNREWASLAQQSVGDGYVMVLFDRQPLWNNGPGSDIEQRDNLEILRRIVAFLAGDLATDETTAAIFGSPMSGEVPLIVQFNGSSSQPGTGSSIVSYGWDFENDGLIDATGETASHTYTGGGTYTARLVVTDDLGQSDSATFLINAIEQLPFGNGGNRWPIPGRIEAEDFDSGGLGIAYQDGDAGNNGNSSYRAGEAVDLQSASDTTGTFNVGWTQSGEWLEYSVDVTQSGRYELLVRVASNNSGGDFRILVDGVDMTGSVATGGTGDWQSWTNITTPEFELEAGVHRIRFEILNGDFNLNWFEFVPVTETFTDYISAYPSLSGNEALPMTG